MAQHSTPPLGEHELAPSRDIFEESDAFRVLFERAPVGVLFFDPDDTEVVMRIAACNPEAARMHGYTPAELVGQSIRVIDPTFYQEQGEDRFRVDDLLELLLREENSRGIAYHQVRTGESLVVEYRTLLLTMRGKRYVVGIEQDVTLREKQRVDLLEARKLLIDAIEAIDDGVMIFDRDGSLVAFNHQATELLPQIVDFVESDTSYSAIIKSYANRPINAAVQGYADHWVALAESPTRGLAKNIPVDFQPGRHHRLSEWPMVDGGIVSVVTDVTELQTALEQANAASHTKSEFLNFISQELQTPLSGMLGLIKRLQSTSLDANQKYLIELLLGSGNAFERVIADIIDLSRIERNELALVPSVLNVKEVIDRIGQEFAPLAVQKNLQFSLDQSGNLDVNVIADEGRLAQLIGIVLENAIKFTDQGKVELAISVSEMEGQVNLEIEIRDTGCGIHADDHQSIFETFRLVDMTLSRNQGGLGVGLAKAKALVELMGGKIGVRSELTKGSAFWIHLDLCRTD